MKAMRQAAFLAAVLGLCHLLAPSPAQAYLDPGTGSYLFQILIAGLVGGLFALKLFWKQIKDFFQKLFGKGADRGGSDETPRKSE